MYDEDDFEQQRHNRRIALMRMQGETNRMETRMHWLWALAAVLIVMAVVCGMAGAAEAGDRGWFRARHGLSWTPAYWYLDRGPRVITVQGSEAWNGQGQVINRFYESSPEELAKAKADQRLCRPVVMHSDEGTVAHPAKGCSR